MFIEAIVRACQVYGIAIAISMVVAVLIKLLVSATGRLTEQSAAGSSQTTPTAPSTANKPAPQASAGKEALADEEVAAIAAAVMAAIGPHHILSIQPKDDDSWSKIGRSAQHQHQPRH